MMRNLKPSLFIELPWGKDDAEIEVITFKYEDVSKSVINIASNHGVFLG
tara:strand:+ start:240 stop:386 length:147 start_codon:yes stop_codon:yes gene_type:complete